MNSILNIEISCFANYDTPASPKPVNLLSWLQSEKYKNEVELIRAVEGKAERNELKAKLPAITPSGLFTYRAEKNLIKHSGFIQFDIDEKGNEELTNYMDMKSHICNIPNVAYCGLSISGKGFWGLIPISQPNKHKEYFKALEQAFKKFKITIDPSCKDVSRLRGYSYDPDGYFNHNAIPFEAIYHEPVKKNQTKFYTNRNSDNLIDIGVNMILPAPDGEKHNILIKASRLMGGYIAGGAVDETEAVIALENAIQTRDIDNFEAAKKTIQSGIAYGKQSPIKAFGAYKIMQFRPVPIAKMPKNEPMQPIQSLAEVKHFEPIESTYHSCKPETLKLESWGQDIIELEHYFVTSILPTNSIKLNKYSMITDVYLFASSHLATVKANNSNRTYLPYLHRLQELKNILINTNFN